MPFLQGAPFPGYGTTPTLFDFDFRTVPLGSISAAALLSRSATYGNNRRGLTFTRSTNSSVQTSPSTIDSSAGANAACIGNRTALQAKRGLVLENLVKNLITGAKQNLTDGSWSPQQNAFYGGASLPTLTSGQLGPDGNSFATRVQCGAITYVQYAAGVGQPGPKVFSSWQTASIGGSQMTMENAISSQGNFSGHRTGLQGVTSTFGRVVCYENPPINNMMIVDGRDQTLGGFGETAKARDCIVDFVQMQSGTFETEAIISGNVDASGMTRDDDRLSYGVGSELISSDGQLRVRFTFSPKFASTEHVVFNGTGTTSLTTATYWWLLSWGATLDGNYVRIRESDKKLAVKFSGTEIVSTNAISWAKYDEVVIELEVGAGVASVARYKLNGGAWNDLVLGTVAETPAPTSNPIAIMRDVNAPSRISTPLEDRGQPPCWLHRITFYNKTPIPPESILEEGGADLTDETGNTLYTELH